MTFRDIVRQHIGPPVNIENIIRGLGIQLDKKAELDSEISGQLERLGPDSYRISANKTDHYLRQRFGLDWIGMEESECQNETIRFSKFRC